MSTPKTEAVCKQELRVKEKNLQEYIDNHPEILTEELPKDREELIQAAEERRKRRVNHQASKKMLADVRVALERLDNSTFGICVDCQSKISDDRLRAMPWVSRCLSCQQQKGVKVH